MARQPESNVGVLFGFIGSTVLVSSSGDPNRLYAARGQSRFASRRAWMALLTSSAASAAARRNMLLVHALPFGSRVALCSRSHILAQELGMMLPPGVPCKTVDDPLRLDHPLHRDPPFAAVLMGLTLSFTEAGGAWSLEAKSLPKTRKQARLLVRRDFE
jgi:hypothetical protein